MNSALSPIKRMYQDLRRRKVFRAAAGYGVAAWLVVAVADVIVPVLRLPDWTMDLVVLLAVAGLPIAVALSWVFDLSADGMIRTTETTPAGTPGESAYRSVAYVIIVLLLVAIGILLWRPFSQAAGASDLRSIAVLPFADFSEQRDAGYLGDGLAEELLNALVGLEGLSVAARTSSFAFKGLNEDVRSIGEKLNVDAVLEGSVRRSEGRVRVTAQLIKVSDGFHLWSQSYDRELDDIFLIQDEIAVAIVDALRVKLGAGENERIARRGGTSFAAYDLYLLGRHHWHQRTPASLQRAVELFTEATESDPDFALAYSGLADAYLLLRDYGDLDVATSQAQAEAAIARALQLDSELAEPYASLGLLRMSRSELTGAELAFRNAIELDSSYSMAHMWLGLVLEATQGPKAAVEEYRAAYRSDPLHPVINGNLATALARMGRYDDARGYLQKSEQANPDSSKLRVHLSWLDSYYGRHDDSVRWALSAAENSDEGNEQARMMLAVGFATMGDAGRAATFLSTGDPETATAQEFDVRATVLLAGGEYARLLSLAQARIARDVETQEHWGLTELAWSGIAQIAQQDYTAAAGNFESFLASAGPKRLEAPRHITILGLLAYAYNQIDDSQQRDAKLARSLEVYQRERVRGWASPAFHAAIAGTYALQGDRESALRALTTATQMGWRDYNWLQRDPRFAALRGDPDYESRVLKMRADLDGMLERASKMVDVQRLASSG